MRLSKGVAAYVAVCLLGSLFPIIASAQTANDLINLFGGVVRAANSRAAQSEWQKLPLNEINCIDRGLQQQGASLENLIQSGIMPSDARLGSIRSDCRSRSAQVPTNNPNNSLHYVSDTQPPDNFLSLRTVPSSRVGLRIKEMPNGTLLEILERRSDGWWHVKVVPSGETGWALSQYGSQTWIKCCAAPPQQQTPANVWNHNGSTVYLVSKGQLREFFYQEPRQGLRDIGVVSGTRLFVGRSIDSRYEGTAFIFNRKCGQIPYQVSGPILDEYRRVVLEGSAPVVGSDCKVQATTPSTLEFSLILPKELDKARDAPGAALTSSNSSDPSFDCSRAIQPDEKLICSNPPLAELDRVVAQGYQFLKDTRGRDFAESIGRPLWQQRRQCQFDYECIKRKQFEAIVAFQNNGAPVQLPPSAPPPQSSQQALQRNEVSAKRDEVLIAAERSRLQTERDIAASRTRDAVLEAERAQAAFDKEAADKAAADKIKTKVAATDAPRIDNIRAPEPVARAASVAVYQTNNANTESQINPSVVGFLIFFAYAIIAGTITLSLVRPPLIEWYNSSTWLVFGTGPVDIFLRQIGFRLSFELFIFGISCIFGALGGAALVIYRRYTAGKEIPPLASS